MDEINEMILDDAMSFVFFNEIENVILGKYEPPDMIGQATNTILNKWGELIKEAIVKGGESDGTNS